MKTILVPTDFSAASRNASAYAVELAKTANCKIILCHSYHTPVPSAEMPVLVNYDDLEFENQERLLEEREFLLNGHSITIECYTCSGFAVDDIIELEKKYSPDLVVMGIRGAGIISEYLLGSISTALIEQTKIPVLVVPEEAKFASPLKIAFACDYNLESTKEVLNPLKAFIQTFHSTLLIINLLKENEKISSSKAVQGMHLENHFSDIPHSYHFPEDNDFVHGLNTFVSEHEANILAIIPHKHNLISRLFKESHTKQMAFHTHIPLLAIPELGHLKN